MRMFAEFHRIIKLPSVTSLTFQDSKSMEGLPIVWSMLQLEKPLQFIAHLQL